MHENSKWQKALDILAENIRRRRKKLKISQSQLADRIGVGVQTINRIEGAKQNPRPHTLTAIAQALECSCLDLYQRPHAPPKSSVRTVTSPKTWSPQRPFQQLVRDHYGTYQVKSNKLPCSVKTSEKVYELLRQVGDDPKTWQRLEFVLARLLKRR